MVTYLKRNNITILHPSEMCADIDTIMRPPDLHETKQHLAKLNTISRFGLERIDKDLGSLYKTNTELRMLVASLELEYTKVVDLVYHGKIGKVRQADLDRKNREIKDLKDKLAAVTSEKTVLLEENTKLKTEIDLMKSISPL